MLRKNRYMYVCCEHGEVEGMTYMVARSPPSHSNVYVQYDCILLKSFVCCCLISLHKARRGLSNSKSIYCAHELIQFPTLLCYTLV